MQVSAVEIIKFIQSEVKMLKRQYEQGSIDLPTLQRAAKHLNNVASFVSILSNKRQ